MARIGRFKVSLMAGAFCVLLLSVIVSLSFGSRNSLFLTLPSPGGTYSVQFSGDRGRPVTPLRDHRVRFKVVKDGALLVTERELHSGDWLDPSFDSLYPDHAWINEQTLQLFRKQNHLEAPVDAMLIENHTNRHISYLRIESIDVALLFDINPGSRSKLSFSRAKGDFKSVYVDGEFSDGQKITGFGKGFAVPRGQGSFVYTIAVMDNQNRIEQLRHTPDGFGSK